MKNKMKQIVGITMATMIGMTTITGMTCAAEEVKNIRIWLADGSEAEFYKTMLSAIDEENDAFTIEYEIFPNDELVSKLQLAPSVGDTPDLVVIDSLRVPLFMTQDMIACIDDYVDDELRNDLLPSVIGECTYDDKLYGVAQFESGLSLWGNKSMLEAAGVRIPTSYTDAWTKEEFEDALSKLKENGLEYPLYLRQNSPRTWYFTYLPVVRSFGGDFMDRETLLTDGTLNSAETVEAFSYISWLVDNGYVDPLCDYDDGFYNKKENALSLVGHWATTAITDALGEDAILIPIPDFGEGVYTGSGSTVWTMTTAAEENGNADCAWEIMKSVVSTENIAEVTTVNGGIPARMSVLENDERFAEGGQLYLYREQLEAGISYLRPLTPAHQTVYDAVEVAATNILLGADPQSELDNAAKSVDMTIVENGWDK
ncbi:MAG: extracellular solute-binding protein [Muricoprocola sp.]